MKFKILLAFVCLLISTTVFVSHESPVGVKESSAEPIESTLSMINTWKIQTAIKRCGNSNNELIYKEYWTDSVGSEDMESTCIAEQFADQAAEEGDVWLDKKAEKLIEECERQGQRAPEMYYLCLKNNLRRVTNTLSSPCKELGEQNLWNEQSCAHLISYIFMEKFNKILNPKKPLLERFKLTLDRISKNTFVYFFINPLVAIIVFIFFVVDVVYLIEKGTWMHVTRVGLFMGPLLLISCFTKDGTRLLLSGIIIIAIFLISRWNHQVAKLKSKKEKPKPIEF